MNKTLLWFVAARPQFFTATIIPITLGAAMAWNHTAAFDWGLFWLTLIGGIFIHAGLDYSNDYYDYKTGNDAVNKTPTPFSGGSRYLREGILRPGQVLAASLLCFGAGSAIGLYLNYLLRTNIILIIGITGVFLAFFYTAGPLRIGYTRCAELATGLGFGPLMVIGAYYVQARSLSLEVLWASVPIGILIALVQYINQFPDYEADKKVRKNNTVVMLGRERAVPYYCIFLILAYCLVVLGVVLRIIPPLALITLLTLPLAVKAMKVLTAHFNSIKELLPANALTIAIHLSFGVLFTAAYLLDAPPAAFAEAPAVNLLVSGAPQGTWAKNDGSIKFRYEKEEGRAGAGACLYLTYGVAAEKQEAGFWLALGGRDLSGYGAMAFWVKGEKGGEVFRAGLKDGSWFEDKLDIKTFLPGGVTTEWQKVTIPLDEFKAIKNWYDMDNFSVTFRNDYGQPYAGVVYIDGLTFEGERTGVERQRAIRWESPALETLSDEQFLDLVERSAAMFFWDEANLENGIIKDSCNSIYEDASPTGSIASVGFGLPVLCVAEKRGWLPKRDVYDRVLTTLKFFRDEAENVHGFYYHFLDMRTGERAGGCELSSIDTALLIAGVVFAGEYFKGTEIERMAKELDDRVDWEWMMNNGSTPSMGWTPERGFLPYRWNSYSEHMVLYFLGIGSDTYPMPAASWDAFARPPNNYKEFKFSGPPPLFIHQYSHIFVDFKGIRDNHMDYFENSVQATLANRQWCIDNMGRSKTYGPDSWGLTACDGPAGYKAYGAPNGENDGTVAPTAAIGSIIFTPELSMKAMKYLYATHKERIWGKYGFVDSFNWDRDWVSSRYIGIDEGPIVLMIENYRTGMIWKYFMQNKNIKRALELCGFKRPGKAPLNINFTF